MRFRSSRIDELCALYPYITQRVAQTRIFTFCVAVHIFVASNRRHFQFGTPIGHSKSKSTGDKLSLKWPWLRHVIHFKFQGSKHTYQE